MRLQAERDHVQPPRWWQNKHAVTLSSAAVAGGVPWVRINRPPRYAPGALADHSGLWAEAVEALIQVCGSRSPGR
ncbi:MAG: hypothetical protein ACI8S6_000745 [Myxococcota bacterium]|jgi:hypothetical protein